jgi:hypothetical protein
LSKLNIKNNNVLEDIKTYPDFYFNTIFSDPPYNLGSQIIINEKGLPDLKRKVDFMNKWGGLSGKELDIFFKHANRVLKYGGYCILYGIERQAFLIQYYAIKNGFEIVQGLYWYNIQAFPKGTSASKMIDKRKGLKQEIVGKNINGKDSDSGSGIYRMNNESSNMRKEFNITKSISDLAKQFDNYKYGIAPFKQTVENILIFKKSCKYKSVIDDLMGFEKGDQEISPAVVNIEDGRVLTNEDVRRAKGGFRNKYIGGKLINGYNSFKSKKPFGRYPSQLFINSGAATILDRQSGIQFSKSDGGCSRINHICNYTKEEHDLLFYEPKVSSTERNKGLENNYQENDHPTLKSIELNKKIITLFKLPEELNQKIYIPFCGVFSEITGAYLAGIKEENIYGCEANQEYIVIGEKRFKYYKKMGIQGELFK